MHKLIHQPYYTLIKSVITLYDCLLFPFVLYLYSLGGKLTLNSAVSLMQVRFTFFLYPLVNHRKHMMYFQLCIFNLGPLLTQHLSDSVVSKDLIFPCSLIQGTLKANLTGKFLSQLKL